MDYLFRDNTEILSKISEAQNKILSSMKRSGDHPEAKGFLTLSGYRIFTDGFLDKDGTLFLLEHFCLQKKIEAKSFRLPQEWTSCKLWKVSSEGNVFTSQIQKTGRFPGDTYPEVLNVQQFFDEFDDIDISSNKELSTG
jgi:hypothetical protein